MAMRKLVKIEDTLQGVEQFREKIRYTGLVTPAKSANPTTSEFSCDVLVTVGGGAFGQELIRNAIEAMQFCQTHPTNWLISAGTELSDSTFSELFSSCPPGIRIVRHIPNLAEVMRNARVSISHSGYNTVADVLRSGCRAVLCPYVDGKETEQLHRARLLSERGLTVLLPPETLAPQTLALAVDQATKLTPSIHNLNLDGDVQTAKILKTSFETLNAG